MPTYNFVNKDTKQTETHYLHISELDKFILDNPHLELSVSSPPIVSGVDGRLRPDSNFRELLKNIKRKSKKDINTYD